MKNNTILFSDEKKSETISVTHVNVRISIVFLLFKLVLLDMLAAVLAMLFFGALSFAQLPDEVRLFIFSQNIAFFVMLAIVKIILTVFLVMQWLNEYYEITPTKIYYRRGIIWRKEDVYEFKSIRSIGLKQGIIGRIFSFGTLNFYSRSVYKYYYLNDIHNPLRYLDILHRLLPDVDVEKEVIREHVREKQITTD